MLALAGPLELFFKLRPGSLSVLYLAAQIFHRIVPRTHYTVLELGLRACTLSRYCNIYKYLCLQPQCIQITQNTRDKLTHLPFDVIEKGNVDIRVCSCSK